MRQHMLNGWLMAALVALVCLLGLTAYAEVRTELPDAGCAFSNTKVHGAEASCDSTSRRDQTAWHRGPEQLPPERQG